jgi:7-cyano-7-deazaguanine synthase in queuosine biosynthesis
VKKDEAKPDVPEKRIDLTQSGKRPPRDYERFDLDRVAFKTARLESYASARWDAALHDAILVAAAVECADKMLKRPAYGWARRLFVRIPVHDPDRWNDPALSASLHDALSFLTGDFWKVEFVQRIEAAERPRQSQLDLPVHAEAVIAFSNGMDSCAVAGLIGAELGDRLVKVRVGKGSNRKVRRATGEPGRLTAFAGVPYRTSMTGQSRESSVRSRGFKFALISGVAAYVAEAQKIIVTESGQGAIAPALITVGHAYPDFRNHPLFTKRMEKFLKLLLGNSVHFEFPRLWSTKGETLRAYAESPGGGDWMNTKTCWRSSQWTSVADKQRQCGVCAACMLRRMSVHAAGLLEDPNTYVAVDLKAERLTEALDPGFSGYNEAFQEYAIAGALHLDHLADMAAADALPAVRQHAARIAGVGGLEISAIENSLVSLLQRHAKEWSSFLESQGPRSYLRHWTRSAA